MELDRLIGPLLLVMFGVLPSILKAKKKRDEAARRKMHPSAPRPATVAKPKPKKLDEALEDFIGEFFTEEDSPPPPAPRPESLPEAVPLAPIPEGPEAVSRTLPLEGADALERIPETPEGYRRPIGREGGAYQEYGPVRKPRFTGPAPTTRVKHRHTTLRGPLSEVPLKRAVLLLEILGPCRALRELEFEDGRS